MKVWMVDPDSGWLYGFPKPAPKDYILHDDFDFYAWLLSEGYPQEKIDYWLNSRLGYVPCRMWQQEIEDNHPGLFSELVDLVKRLRDLGDHAAFEPHMHHTAADRIEELTAERDEALNQLDSARHSVDVLEKRVAFVENERRKTFQALLKVTKIHDEVEAKLSKSEALLAKAVRLISEKPILATYEDDVQWQKYVIAELTGGKDE